MNVKVMDVIGEIVFDCEKVCMSDGDCSIAICLDNSGGPAVIDDCGVCDGGNADLDCAGVCLEMQL